MYGKTKTLTGRGVWGIHTYMHQNLAKMQKLSQGEGFWVSSPKTLTGRGVLKRTLNENSTIAKHVCMYLRFQNPSPCEGFFKNPLSVKSFSKVLSLWRVFQSPSPYDGRFCLGRKHSSLLGFQKYPPSQFKNKWTGMLQESLFQCVFEPKTFCENLETYIHSWGL